MPEDPNKLLRFWQEIKRRRVIRVSAMYAATAFIIIEAGDIVLPRLGLPDWTVTLLIILLIAGFPIAIILSWIFDVTPEGIERTEPVDDRAAAEVQPSRDKKKRKLKLSDGIIAVLLMVVLILLYPKIFKPDRIEQFRSEGEISVAVMPFQNLTGDTAKNFWQEMVQDNLITLLSNSEALKVRQTESINTLLQHEDLTSHASLTPIVASNVSRKLEAGVFMHGSINRTGEIIRLNAKLIDSETREVFKSFQIDGTEENILYMADSLSGMVEDYLVVAVLEKEVPPDFQSLMGSTKSPEALRYLLDGRNAFLKRNYPEARQMFHRAIEIDTNFVFATVMLAFAYGNPGYYEEAKKLSLRAYEDRDRIPRTDRLMVDYTYAYFILNNLVESNNYIRELLEIDDQQAVNYYNLGVMYNEMHQYNRAIPEYEKALEIHKKWEIKPIWVYNYTGLGVAYHEMEMYRKEKKLYRKAEKDFPGDHALLFRQAILELSQGRTGKANEYIERYISVRKENAASEAAIASGVGGIYWNAEMPEKAEDYYRKALSLEPERAFRLNSLAFLLIDEELNVEEGLALVEQALESDPGHYSYLDTRGWGLYKQGRYEEAVEVLEQAWVLKPMYDHELYLHLEEAKKALAGREK